MFNNGLVLGKFMPAHKGHLHLIRFASQLCRHVTVVVDCIEGEAPSASKRAEYLRAECQGLSVTVVALSEPTPQEPSAHPEFWSVWRHLLTDACGGTPDALVCSMEYGLPLAEALGGNCRFIPLDIARTGVEISATMIREDPWGHWDMILPHARADYLTRIAIEGPESTGKSTIARQCAGSHEFTYCQEWATEYVTQQARAGLELQEPDMLTIALAQTAMEHSLDLTANRALICDSSLVTTIVWSEFLYGRVDPRIVKLFEKEEANRPKMRYLMTPETPWVADLHRTVAQTASAHETRRHFFDSFVAHYRDYGLPYSVVPGGFKEKTSYLDSVISGLKTNFPVGLSRGFIP